MGSGSLILIGRSVAIDPKFYFLKRVHCSLSFSSRRGQQGKRLKLPGKNYFWKLHVDDRNAANYLKSLGRHRSNGF